MDCSIYGTKLTSIFPHLSPIQNLELIHNLIRDTFLYFTKLPYDFYDYHRFRIIILVL